MSNTFIVSDTHFGHVGVTRFLTDEGTKMRPWDTVEAMDERYLCLCVEHTDYTPISLEDAKDRFETQQ